MSATRTHSVHTKQRPLRHHISQQPMNPTAPTVVVADLTASIGLHALMQLGVHQPTSRGFWSQIVLADVPHAPRIDWLRPNQPEELDSLHASPAAVALIVGPGSVHLLRKVLAHATIGQAATVWIFLLPNALLEEIALRAVLEHSAIPVCLFQLHNSAPETLWFILMEQMGKLNVLSPSAQLPSTTKDPMSSNLKETMNAAMSIDGALAVALVDYRSGMCLAQAGSGLNLELAAAGNTQVVQAKLNTLETLGLRKGIEDILITLSDQYHLIRMTPNHPGLFLYLVLDKNKGNLALARYKLTDIERTLRV